MEALELASWPQMEKGRQSVMSTFEPRFGGAHFWGTLGPNWIGAFGMIAFVLIWFARSIQANAIWWRRALLVLSLMTRARRKHSTAFCSHSLGMEAPAIYRPATSNWGIWFWRN